MLKLNGKTPVSYLQEQLILMQICPKYELVYNGVENQEPKFTFKVEVGTISEEGTGKNKQQAKHKAAEKMLKTLKLIDHEPNKEEVEQQQQQQEQQQQQDQEDYLDPVKNNHIGILKEYCQTNSYPDPIYEEEDSAGPAHSKIFKIACIVSQIRQNGVARTKKAAKHLAAEKMLQRLRQCVKHVDSSSETILVKKCKNETEETLDNCKIAKTTVIPPVHNFLAFYKDHYKAYLDLHEESPTLTKLINNKIVLGNHNCVQLAKTVAEELNVSLSVCTDNSSRKKKPLVLVSMGLTPSIAEFGVDFQNAIFNLLKTLLILSK